MSQRRALHFVFKVGDRRAMMDFLKGDLGMKVLRHEEFDSGCEATCNGPYRNKWSKTMVGYGPEDSNFVLEITYNYPVDKYRLGNDIRAISVAVPAGKLAGLKSKTLVSPAGYKFSIEEDPDVLGKVTEVTLAVSDLSKSLDFWKGILDMEECKGVEMAENEAVLTFGDDQARLRLRKTDPDGSAVDHATAFGRIAFSLPTGDLPDLEKSVKAAKLGKVKTSRLVLPTPGKADVEVVILEDPDDHEICFVGQEGFSELSQIDPNAEKLLEDAMEADKSNEWYEKKKLSKDEAK